MSSARVQSRGQITVPQHIRVACGIEPGSLLLFRETGPDRFECLVFPSPRQAREIVRRYTMDGSAPDLQELREASERELAQEVLRDVVREPSVR